MPNRVSSNACTFTDRHIHGIAGVDFATSPVSDIHEALQLLASRGTTQVTASLPTLPQERLALVLQRLSPLHATGAIAGIHLEGPYLAPDYAGAHPPEALLDPSTGPGQRFLTTVLAHQQHYGSITMMTLAPELPGVAELLPLLVEHGIQPALGHTAASYRIMRQAIETILHLTHQPVVITHCYNAMRGFHHRDPGPLLAVHEAAARGEVIVELIADGHHVELDIIRWWFTTHPDRIRLVSDASAATVPSGVPPLSQTPPRLGETVLAAVTGAVPHLADGATLASGGQDLLAVHDALVAAGIPHHLVCAAM